MKLMVLDGNSILNRAYYGIRPLSTREGLYTHAVYGFITTLQRLLDEENPEALCVTFDRREPTFRHRADADYKAQRKPMPPELAMQLPVMKQVLSAMSVPCYELAGYEADDLIGTISRKCQAAGWDCVIVTGDKDSLQLITDRTKVKLVSTRMGQTTTKDMTPETFREQYGFDPIHMIDLKALMGDTSDNIPGVPGVGEKTAMALVQEYGAIGEIYRLLPDLHAKPAAIAIGWPPSSPTPPWTLTRRKISAGPSARSCTTCSCGWNFRSSSTNTTCAPTRRRRRGRRLPPRWSPSGRRTRPGTCWPSGGRRSLSPYMRCRTCPPFPSSGTPGRTPPGRRSCGPETIRGTGRPCWRRCLPPISPRCPTTSRI